MPRLCNCYDAQRHTAIEKAKEKMSEETKDSKEPVRAILSGIITAIGQYFIDEATIKVDAENTFKLKRSSMGKIVLEIKHSEKAQIEL